MDYATIREMVVQGVIRGAASSPRTPLVPPSLDRIRAQFDAAFVSINSSVAQAYAAKESKREMLRVARTLSFVAGDCAVPTNTLKSFIEDCTFEVTGKRYTFRRYPEWIRNGDRRLGQWTEIGDTLKAKTPAPVAAYTGSVLFSSIESPEVPVTETAEYVAPSDFISDFIDATTVYIGKSLSMEESAALVVA